MLAPARTGSRRLVPKLMYLTTVSNSMQMFPPLGELGEDSHNPNCKQQQQEPFADSVLKALHTLSHLLLPLII